MHRTNCSWNDSGNLRACSQQHSQPSPHFTQGRPARLNAQSLVLQEPDFSLELPHTGRSASVPCSWRSAQAWMAGGPPHGVSTSRPPRHGHQRPQTARLSRCQGPHESPMCPVSLPSIRIGHQLFPCSLAVTSHTAVGHGELPDAAQRLHCMCTRYQVLQQILVMPKCFCSRSKTRKGLAGCMPDSL